MARYVSYNSNPYPNGSLHLGHARIYVLSDVNVRYREACGHDVLFCVGFDAFGLPTEVAAAQSNTSAQQLTESSIATMRRQFDELEVQFDRTYSTSDPVHVHRTQALFLELFRAGFAFRERRPVNWCQSCQTVLAEVQVVDGACWRCSGPVVSELQNHWLLAMKPFAREIEEELTGSRWPDSVKGSVGHMIGRREGWDVDLSLAADGSRVTAFIPEQEWLPDVEFGVVPSHHPLAARIRERGVLHAMHPSRRVRLPIVISDYYDYYDDSVVNLAAPAHVRGDELFRETWEGELTLSVQPLPGDPPPVSSPPRRTIRYRLRDWLVSRQRYWGVPIPIVHCERCGAVPLAEDRLPIMPPDEEVFVQGLDPRRDESGYYRMSCPRCGTVDARMETDTLDGLVCTFWGQYRSLLPEQVAPRADLETPISDVDHVFYQCGNDCIRYLLTFLYANVVFRRLGFAWARAPFDEVFTNGMVLKDNRKMSKSLGNSVSPEEVLRDYGAATLRLYVASMGVPDRDVNWDWDAVHATAAALRRLESVFSAEVLQRTASGEPPAPPEGMALRAKSREGWQEALRRIRKNLHQRAYNKAADGLLAIAADLEAEVERFREHGYLALENAELRALIQDFLRLLHPFCPSLAEDLWEAGGHAPAGAVDRLPEMEEEPTCRWLVKEEGRYLGHFFDRPDLERDEALERALLNRRVQAALADRQTVDLRIHQDPEAMVLEVTTVPASS